MHDASALEPHHEPDRRIPRTAILVHSAGLFVFALDIPIVSVLALDLAAVDVLFRLTRFHRIDGGFAWRLTLLGLAMGSYYAISAGHGYFAFSSAMQLAFLGVGAYGAGYWAGHVRRSGSTHAALVPLLAGVAGAVAYSVLSVLARPSGLSREAAEVADRLSPNVWGDGFVNATGLGARAALGMCLLPALLFLVPEPGLRRGRAAAVLGAAGAAGLYVNLSLQNRAPFLSFAAALVAMILVFATSRGVGGGPKAARLLPILGGALVIVLLPLERWIALFGIAQRFQAEGLGTARFSLWGRVLSNLFVSLDGGRAYAISESHAHNLWLDVAYDAGPLPFFLLLAFHVSHARPLVDLLRRPDSTNARIVFAGLGAAFLVGFMGEPALAMSISFFALSCLYLGLVLGLRGPRSPAPEL